MYEYQYKKGDHVSDWCDTKEAAKQNYIGKYGEADFRDSELLKKPKRV